jgi:GTPase SAR1 family protein
MTAEATPYEIYQIRRKQLADLINRARPVYEGLDMQTWLLGLDKLRDRLATERFRVMVLGEFKRGKSTFINALLRAEVLPSDIAPCTAVINEVKWGDTPRAFLHFREPLPERHTPIPSDARRHLDKHRGGKVPPMDIPVADLTEFVRIPDPTADQAASVAESPYEWVEVFWPLELCRNGVEIIDSPGLNEHHTRTKTTRDYLAHIDAVVFVMSVHALASESELALIDNELRANGHDYLFFVCNRMDELRRREDRDKITAYAYAKLADRTRFNREGIFFLSAVDALEGRLNNEPAAVNRSGIVPLEKSLERFLGEDRGRIKLLQPAGQLARGLRTALSDIVPARRKLLDDDVKTLRRRLSEMQPHLDQATRKRDMVARQVEAARLRVKDAVRREAERFFSTLAQDVPLWARQIPNETVINVLKVWAIKEQANKVARDVVKRLQSAIETSLTEWERRELRPLLEQQMGELTESVNASLDPFLEYLDNVKARLTGGLETPSLVSTNGMVSLDRVLTGTGGAVLGVGLAVAALVPGIGQLVAAAGLTSVVSVVATKVGALLLSIVNPITLGAVVMGTLALSQRRGVAMADKIKMEVAGAVAEQLRREGSTRSAAIAEEVYEQTAPLAAAIGEGLDRELGAVREQVDAVIRHKEQSEAEVEKQRHLLGQQEAVLRQLNDELNELILELGQRR